MKGLRLNWVHRRMDLADLAIGKWVRTQSIFEGQPEMKAARSKWWWFFFQKFGQNQPEHLDPAGSLRFATAAGWFFNRHEAQHVWIQWEVDVHQLYLLKKKTLEFHGVDLPHRWCCLRLSQASGSFRHIFGSNCVNMSSDAVGVYQNDSRIWFSLRRVDLNYCEILKSLIETASLRYTITCATYAAGQAMLWVWPPDQISLCGSCCFS